MPPSLAELSSALIGAFEGPEKLTAFKDPGGVWTIGRGHTLNVKAGDTCTHNESVAYFTADQAPLLAMVASEPLVKAAAFVSFGYNVGRAALHAVLMGADNITNPLHTTDKHGNVQPGLVSRRLLERLLVDSASPQIIPVPVPSGHTNATADGEGLVSGGR
jgi:GH24 family phage-related lysozyme (muramidase)